MLECEGYKMFYGVMSVSLFDSDTPIEGVWLYKPEYDCWYCNGRSYPNSICTLVSDKTGY